jgi:hypothetical protein
MKSSMIELQAMLTIWRRHTAECPHRGKGPVDEALGILRGGEGGQS